MPLLSNMELDRYLIGGLTAGKKWATGISAQLPANTSPQTLTITGLSFKPSIIIADAIDININQNPATYRSIFADDSYGWAANGYWSLYSANTGQFSGGPITSQAFGQAQISVCTYGTPSRYRWVAIG